MYVFFHLFIHFFHTLKHAIIYNKSVTAKLNVSVTENDLRLWGLCHTRVVKWNKTGGTLLMETHEHHYIMGIDTLRLGKCRAVADSDETTA